MNSFIQSLWLSNIELSLLLTAILIARLAIRKTAKIYNAYLLWASIPFGLVIASFAAKIEFTEAPISTVNIAVNSYILEPQNTFNSWALIGILWACMTLILLARLVRQHWLLRTQLARMVDTTEHQFTSRYPIILINKSNFSPAVYGFLKPKIYFPVHLIKELNDEQIDLIIRHEEQHIKQQHLWLNLAWDITVCALWFNPLAYISRQCFRHDQELYCDYLVLNDSTRHDQQSYGHALLSTVSATHSVSLLCSWKAFNQLEERIMNIKQSTKLRTKQTTRLLLLICTTSIVAISSIYAVSAADYSKKPKVHSSIEDNGDATYIVDLGDKRYVDENGQRYVIESKKGLNKKREITAQEEAEFTAQLEKAKKKQNGDSLTHSIRDGNEEIIWRTGNISYIEENGKRFVKENGVTRRMTKAEQKAFKAEIRKGQKDEVEYRKALQKAKAKQRKDLSSGKSSTLSESLELATQANGGKNKKPILSQLVKQFERTRQQLAASQTEIRAARASGALSNEVADSIVETLEEKVQELSQQKRDLQEYLAHNRNS